MYGVAKRPRIIRIHPVIDPRLRVTNKTSHFQLIYILMQDPTNRKKIHFPQWKVPPVSLIIPPTNENFSQ